MRQEQDNQHSIPEHSVAVPQESKNWWRNAPESRYTGMAHEENQNRTDQKLFVPNAKRSTGEGGTDENSAFVIEEISVQCIFTETGLVEGQNMWCNDRGTDQIRTL